MNPVSLPQVIPRGPPPSQSTFLNTSPRPKKLRRITRACDYCHKRSIRCRPSQEDATRCQNCLDFAINCTYNRPAKKRGIKSGNATHSGENIGSSVDGEQDARMLLELTNGSHGNGTFNVLDRFSITENKNIVLADEGKISDLVEVYFEVVYPIFPLFHRPTLIRRMQNRDYLTDDSFLVDIMAICALSSARARDGALFPGRWDRDHFKNPTSELFFAAAKETIPQDLSEMRGIDWMRTCALMALYGIQVGKIEIMHQYLGIYRSLVDMDNLHDEKNWPKSRIVETELRRRLFWSMYSMEVFSSIVWGSIIRCRESQCNVSYPSEVDDEFFSDQNGYHLQEALQLSNRSSQERIINPTSWLHGWNFVTDLYRILEHAMYDYRSVTNVSGSFSPADLFKREIPHQSVVLNKVMEMYQKLPTQFKEAKLAPQDEMRGLENKSSFQAADITATMQLVRMVLFTSDDATVDQKCAIARELLDSFAKIPGFFLRAISSPLLHHFAGIGAILGSVIEGPLSEPSYLQLREVLLAMAELLASLEADFNENTHVGAASRLRNQVHVIDSFMSQQRQTYNAVPTTSSSSNGLPLTQSFLNPSVHSSVLPNAAGKSEMNGARIHGVSDVNIDPSLQAALLNPTNTAISGDMYKFQTVGRPNGVLDYAVNSTGSMNGISGGDMNGAAGTILGHFQIPPELLEGWPWPLDAPSTSGTGSGGGFESFRLD